MKPEIKLRHEFVEYIPSDLKDKTIYVSMPYATVAHKCCCGCGNEVITPLSPTDWQLIFDGRSISLSPSIGNWNLKCQSHYFITKNKVQWAPRWSQQRIEAGRAYDSHSKRKFYGVSNALNEGREAKPNDADNHKNFWGKLKKIFF